MKYVNNLFLQQLLVKELKKGKTQGDVAKEAGVSRQCVSMSLSGRYPFSSHVAQYLGYRRVRESLFEKEAGR